MSPKTDRLLAGLIIGTLLAIFTGVAIWQWIADPMEMGDAGYPVLRLIWALTMGFAAMCAPCALYSALWHMFTKEGRAILNKTEEKRIIQENIKTWNRENKRFIRKMNRKIDREIDNELNADLKESESFCIPVFPFHHDSGNDCSGIGGDTSCDCGSSCDCCQ